MKSMVKKLKLSLRSGSSEKRKEKEKAIQEERWFLDNGSKFLRELIADCNGKSIPIRNFSPEQILKATNNFDSSCFVSQAGLFQWYRGKIEDRSYMIKIFSDTTSGFPVKLIYNDIVLSARMSNHINFLKLLGCCLEFPFPVLLYEFAEHGVMNARGGIMVNGEESLLPWSLRLKIGKDIANAVSYLHMAFPKIIIHRDVKPRHVLLDKNWTAKLSDLSSSIILPEGKTRIEAPIVGSLGYLDPLYCATNFVTEYTDVFSFGVFLLVILTGKPAIITGSDGDAEHALSSYGDPQHVLRSYVRGLCEKGKLDEVIDPVMINDITSGQRSEMEAYVLFALRCCAERDEDRPKMIQVAKELKRIERIELSLDAISGFLKPEILEDGLSGQRNPEARLRSCSY